MTEKKLPMYRADARISPEDTLKEWVGCTACTLGLLREERRNHPLYPEPQAQQVFSDGKRRGVMFVGGSPGWMPESKGHFYPEERNEALFPETGYGSPLRMLAERMQLLNPYYTGATLCRPCNRVMIPETEEQNVVVRRPGGVPTQFLDFRDRSPTAEETNACRSRLLSEVYAVDPLLIITLGETAARALFGRPTQVPREPQIQILTLDGAARIPRISEKTGKWGRKVHGKWESPTDPFEVKYPVLPTVSLRDAVREQMDRSTAGAFTSLLTALKLADDVVRRYLKEQETA